MSDSNWRLAANEWLDDGGEFPAQALSGAQIITPADATLIVSLLERQVDWLGQELLELPDVRSLLIVFEKIETTQALMHLARNAMPPLLDIFKIVVERIPTDDDVLGYLLMLFSRFGTSEGWEQIAEAAGDARLCNLWVWDGFIQWPREQDPIIPELVKSLYPEKTEDAAAVATLFWFNQMARNDQLVAHPYDLPAGVERLMLWLTHDRSDTERRVSGKAAAGTIPFIAKPHQQELFHLADTHPDAEVRLESAWAHGFLRHDEGIQTLVSACDDDELAANAAAYLDDLQAGHLVPEELRKKLADFQE